MARVLLVVPNISFRDEELKALRDAIEEYGYDYEIVAPESGEIIGMIGDRFTVDRTVEQVKAEDFDGVILIGGVGTRQLFYLNALHELIRDTVANDKLLGAIGMAVVVIAQIGVLRGRKATGAVEDKDRIIERGASYLPEPVVVDHQIVTASGHEVIDQFVSLYLDLLR